MKRGRSVEVEMGSVYDWRGEEVPVPADWGVHVEVVPDGGAEGIAVKRDSRKRLQASLDHAPMAHGLQCQPGKREPVPEMEEVAGQVAARLRASLSALWRDLRAAEIVVAEVSRDFAGDDGLRNAITATLARLQNLVPWVEEFAGPVQLGKPAAEAVEETRRLLLLEIDYGS